MRREPFDRELEELLKEKAEPVRMTDEDEKRTLARILDRVGEPEQKEDSVMFRRFNGKKILVAAAALCLIGAFGAVAAGKIDSVSSSVRVDQPDYHSAADVAADADRLGFVPKAVDQFSNGYEFSKGYFVMLEGADENQAKVAESPSVMVDYRKGSGSVILNIEAPMAGLEQESSTEMTREYGDVTLNYFHSDSLFVGTDYELTQEEQALVDAGELNVGYGAPGMERQEVTNYFVTWSDDGGNYSLMAGDDTGLTADDLFLMAEEIVDSAN